MTSPWVDGEGLNAANMYARTTQPISQLQGQATALAQMALRTRSTTATIPDSTNTPIATFPDAVGSIIGSIAYANGVYTSGVAGFYKWSSTVSFAGAAASHRAFVAVFVNGSLVLNGRQDMVSSSNQPYTITGGGDLLLAVGDTVQVYVYQSSSAPMTVTPRSFSLGRIA